MIVEYCPFGGSPAVLIETHLGLLHWALGVQKTAGNSPPLCIRSAHHCVASDVCRSWSAKQLRSWAPWTSWETPWVSSTTSLRASLSSSNMAMWVVSYAMWPTVCPTLLQRYTSAEPYDKTGAETVISFEFFAWLFSVVLHGIHVNVRSKSQERQWASSHCVCQFAGTLSDGLGKTMDNRHQSEREYIRYHGATSGEHLVAGIHGLAHGTAWKHLSV